MARLTLREYCPDAADMWYQPLNNEITPDDVMGQSKKMAYFQCKHNPSHIFNSRISDMTRGGICRGCIYCDRKNYVIIEGENDLFTKCPEAKEMWDWETNIGLDGTKLRINDSRVVSFKCSLGHVNKLPIYKFVEKPICLSCKKLFVYNFPEIANYYDSEKNVIDIYTLKNYSDEEVYWKCSKGHSFSKKVNYFQRKGEFDCLVCNWKIIQKGINTLDATNPELCKSWSPNNEKKIDNYHYWSKGDFLWICEKCHGEYACSIREKIYGYPCCYCSDIKFLQGLNSVAEKYPELIKEWSDKNTLRANEVFYKNSYERIIWECSKCHYEYITFLHNRVENESIDESCPCCSGSILVKGKNSFADIAPHLIPYWGKNNWESPDKMPIALNNNIYNFFTNRFYFICCKCGGEYLLDYKDKNTDNDICPYCTDRELLKGLNSFADKYPELIEEWDSSNKLRLDDILFKENRRILWRCKNCNGTYYRKTQEKLADRECPYCSDKKLLKGLNSFADKYPELLEEWDLQNNYLIDKPDNVIFNSNKRVWWKCKVCNQLYKLSISSKILYDKRKMKSCHYCKGLRRKKYHYF